jgi:hypothetical protein
MRIDRKKFFNETAGTIDCAFDIIDGLCAALEHYINSDECAAGYGRGCFCYPEREVKQTIKDNEIDTYIIFDT